MADTIEGSTGTADNAAYGKHIHQQNVTMQNDLTNALQELRLELWRVRRDMDQMVASTTRYWFSLVLVLVVVMALAVIGDRQVTSMRTELHDLQEQTQTLRQQVSTLQYQVQTLRETR